MKLNSLQYTEGSRKVSKREGRGLGSGIGKNGGHGNKGQNSRSGGGTRLGFEGGQNPIYRRLPKRGFNHFGRVEFSVVNVCDLNKFEDGTVVNPALLVKEGLIPANYAKVKVLGNGELTKKLTVKANKFSSTAKTKIENVGGTTEVI